MDAKFIIALQTCTLTKDELSQLAVDYDIPQNVRVLLPQRTQTIFDAPLGFIGLYTHHFTLYNLRVPIPKFICEGEPSVDLLRAFLNLGFTSNWLTLLNRSGSGIPKTLTKPITHIEGWKGSFFFIENRIVPFEYLELLLENNKLDKKSFKDMDFRSFMMEGIDGEFDFIPEGGMNDEGSSSTKSVNNEALITDAEPLTNRKVSASSKAAGKRKQTVESSRKEPQKKELKDSADCHWVVAHQAVLDNMLNSMTRKLMSIMSKVRASCDVIWEREVEKDKAHVQLERRCITFKEVAALKEPFDLEKIPGYRPSSKKEFNQVGDDLATASYPFISEAIVDPYASLEELLSKKPKSLRSKPTSSNLKPSSLKAPNLEVATRSALAQKVLNEDLWEVNVNLDVLDVRLICGLTTSLRMALLMLVLFFLKTLLCLHLGFSKESYFPSLFENIEVFSTPLLVLSNFEFLDSFCFHTYFYGNNGFEAIDQSEFLHCWISGLSCVPIIPAVAHLPTLGKSFPVYAPCP
ncbi:hypothetical protein Tco_0646381 [Tanacetum coccineum]